MRSAVSRKIAWIPAITMFLTVTCMNVMPVSAANAPGTQQDAASGEEAAWNEDLDQKIDTTIKILQVIKEEVKDIQPPGRYGLAAPDSDWGASLSRWIRKISRAWRKIRKATRKEGTPEEKAAQAEETVELTKDLSQKLDKTIRAMTVIREELEKIQEEEEKAQ